MTTRQARQLPQTVQLSRHFIDGIPRYMVIVPFRQTPVRHYFGRYADALKLAQTVHRNTGLPIEDRGRHVPIIRRDQSAQAA